LFNKKLEGEQLAILIVKNSSRNPLWLQIACEELRIYGDFSTITGFMEKLEDGLPKYVKRFFELVYWLLEQHFPKYAPQSPWVT